MNTVTLKFAIDNDTAKTVLNKLLLGRFNWSHFLKSYGPKLRAQDILSYDIKTDDEISVYKTNYRLSVNKIKTHFQTGQGIACGSKRFPSQKRSRNVRLCDCAACKRTSEYKRALEKVNEPIKDMISVLGQLG